MQAGLAHIEAQLSAAGMTLDNPVMHRRTVLAGGRDIGLCRQALDRFTVSQKRELI